MEILFFLLLGVYQFISRVFLMVYPQVAFFTVPFGLLLALLFAAESISFLPISVVLLFPQILTLLETHLSFLPLIDRTVILYGTCIGLGFSYLHILKRFSLLKKLPNIFLLAFSIGIGVVYGLGILKVTTPTLAFYSLKNPVFLVMFPILFALGEEVVFRGIVAETIWKQTHHWISIVTPALIAASFGMTFDPKLLALMFGFQLVLSSIYIVTRSFWCSFACNVAAKVSISVVLYTTIYPLVTPFP